MQRSEPIHNLQRTIVLFAVAAVLVTGLVVAVAGVFPLYGEFRSRIEQELLSNWSHKRLAVDQYFTRLRDIARQVTSRTRLRDLLEDYNEGRIDAARLEAESRQKLLDAMMLTREMVGVTRFDRHARVALAVGVVAPRAEAGVAERLTNDGGETELSGPFRVGGHEMLRVTAPIVDRDGGVVGVDVVLFSLEPLKEMLAVSVGEAEAVVLGRLEGEALELVHPFPRRLDPAMRAAARRALERAGRGESGHLVERAGCRSLRCCWPGWRRFSARAAGRCCWCAPPGGGSRAF